MSKISYKKYFGHTLQALTFVVGNEESCKTLYFVILSECTNCILQTVQQPVFYKRCFKNLVFLSNVHLMLFQAKTLKSQVTFFKFLLRRTVQYSNYTVHCIRYIYVNYVHSSPIVLCTFCIPLKMRLNSAKRKKCALHSNCKKCSTYSKQFLFEKKSTKKNLHRNVFQKRDINQLPKKVKIPQAQKINFVKELSDRFVANFFSHHLLH